MFETTNQIGFSSNSLTKVVYLKSCPKPIWRPVAWITQPGYVSNNGVPQTRPQWTPTWPAHAPTTVTGRLHEGPQQAEADLIQGTFILGIDFMITFPDLPMVS